jgi:hypothetical protein
LGSAFSTAADWFVEVWPIVATVLVVPFVVLVALAVVISLFWSVVAVVVKLLEWVARQAARSRDLPTRERLRVDMDAEMEAQNYIWREEDGKLSGYQQLVLAMRKMADEGVPARGMVIWEPKGFGVTIVYKPGAGYAIEMVREIRGRKADPRSVAILEGITRRLGGRAVWLEVERGPTLGVQRVEVERVEVGRDAEAAAAMTLCVIEQLQGDRPAQWFMIAREPGGWRVVSEG